MIHVHLTTVITMTIAIKNAHHDDHNDHNNHDDHNDHNTHNETIKKRRLIFVRLPLGNTLHEQLKLAARAVSGLMEFKAKLDGKRLPVEIGADGKDMDMSQVCQLAIYKLCIFTK